MCEPAVADTDEAAAEWVAVAGWEVAEGLFWEDVVGICGKGGHNWLKDWV